MVLRVIMSNSRWLDHDYYLLITVPYSEDVPMSDTNLEVLAPSCKYI